MIVPATQASNDKEQAESMAAKIQAMGFRQFLLRGLENVSREWTPVCLVWGLRPQ